MTRTSVSNPPAKRTAVDLDGQYREIGIPAVAAALPYQGATRKAADASPTLADEEWHRRVMEAA